MSKSVLITGGSRGIGAATAVYFARMGYKVAITYNKSIYAAKAMKETMALNGTEFLAIPCDVAQPVQVESAVNQTVSAFGGLDVMINNAGIALNKLITDTTNDEWQNILNTNLSGVFYGCRAAARVMIPRQSGSIVNLSSIWGKVGASMEVAYSASKGAVNSFTKALAKELAPSNIQVNAIACGVIDTDMNSHLSEEDMAALRSEIPADRIGTPEEVAQLILQTAQAPAYMTGQIITIDGGWC